MTNNQPTEPIRDGRCQWCNGSAEGDDSTLVFTARGYWWHRDCAEDNLTELEEALA